MKTQAFIVFLWVVTFIFCCEILTAQVKIGDNPYSVSSSAILELEKSNMGLLITRISLNDVLDNTTIPSPAQGLLIYNNDTSGTGTYVVYPGFYSWDTNSVRWHRLVTSIHPSTGEVWIDSNQNILSSNSANQTLSGIDNIILGWGAFQDNAGVSSHVIAFGQNAARNDTTTGNANVTAMGYQCAFNNGGIKLNAFGSETAMNNDGDNVNALGEYAAYANTGHAVNAFGNGAAASNTANFVNAMGGNAGHNNAGQSLNAFGLEAAYLNLLPNVNALGEYAAYGNNGSDVNAMGCRAGGNNMGNHVNALGHESAQQNMGENMNAMGFQAGKSNNGTSVNLFGTQAGLNNNADDVNAFGSGAGRNNLGVNVNAFGLESAENNAELNVNAFGQYAARDNLGANLNALGYLAAHTNTGASVNAIGVGAAQWNDGDFAIAIGEESLKGFGLVHEGAGNIGIGYHAGNDIGTGQFNVAIGHDVHVPDSSGSYQINIADQIIRDNNGVIRLKDLIQLTPLSTPQASPVEGMIFYHSANHVLMVYNGTEWKTIAWSP
jgi:hypothetical protein